MFRLNGEAGIDAFTQPRAHPPRAKARSPVPSWLREYSRGYLRRDRVAGATTAALLVPQGMAYAVLAGLLPIAGLYASTTGLFTQSPGVTPRRPHAKYR